MILFAPLGAKKNGVFLGFYWDLCGFEGFLGIYAVWDLCGFENLIYTLVESIKDSAFRG